VHDRSHISRLDLRPNANTRLAEAEPRIDPVALDEAYARALAIEQQEPRAPDAVRLVWMKAGARAGELGFRDLPARPDAFVVVGRHARCDVVVPADPVLALRHLLVRAVRLDDGSLATRVLDLKTGLGFHLDDDAQRRALVASGPVALRVGRYALVALPPGTLPGERPAPDILDAPKLPAASAPRLTTSVTTLPPAPMLEDIARDVAAAGFARITLRRDDAWASVEVSEAALDAGVLVGRADRCEEKLKKVLTEAVSRTHLLLLREHDVVHAFDVASTQGTFADDKKVRRVRMPDRGGTLRLGQTSPVVLEWHPRAS
jgi:hypothetical protein